ncbi:uncharacterized protein MELLADRAFT_66252 [Melampsora larici-populina 98AG31]|uniref:Uncharacterized protein n=1 Tax=Melampsora larici-populina (strain 98AG31 / pathotype 3-4-7) TaxID=747676 RepID=F4RYF9_MELLP|nr:uncharacterized protein MELLADRAFT_66252 [Melampsora larici-populina 98AG31]EGG02463.1 hypothetical protein MELLADRAFT_66252 [Melampsora larici-populina 98AG31]
MMGRKKKPKSSSTAAVQPDRHGSDHPIELEGNPVHELPAPANPRARPVHELLASRPVHELAASNPVYELPGSRPVYELPGSTPHSGPPPPHVHELPASELGYRA